MKRGSLLAVLIIIITLFICLYSENSLSAKAPVIPKHAVKVSSSMTLDHLVPATVYATARKKILAHLAQGTDISTNVTVFAGKNVAQPLVTARVKALNKAIRFWSDQYQPPAYKFLLFGYDDADYAFRTMVQEGISGGEHFKESIADTSPKYCSFGNSGNATSFYLCIATERNFEEAQTVPHEYTHSVTYHLLNNKYSVPALPCWLVEGLGSYYGMQLGFEGSRYKSYRANMERGMANRFTQEWGDKLGKSVYEVMKSGSNREVSEMVRMAEVPTSVACMPVGAMAYLYGGYAVEVTVAVWGVDAIPGYLATFDPSVDWQTNWQRYFGVSVEQFHAAVIPYFRSFAEQFR
jgi:hypothetical protein